MYMLELLCVLHFNVGQSDVPELSKVQNGEELVTHIAHIEETERVISSWATMISPF